MARGVVVYYFSTCLVGTTQVEEVVQCVVVFVMVDDGYAVNLIFYVVEFAFATIGVYGFADVDQFLLVDCHFGFSEFVCSSCLHFDEVDAEVFHGYDVEFASFMKVPVGVEYSVSVFCQVVGGNQFTGFSQFL